jgi:hypothetical protein
VVVEEVLVQVEQGQVVQVVAVEAVYKLAELERLVKVIMAALVTAMEQHTMLGVEVAVHPQ